MGLQAGDRLAVLNPYHYLARNLSVGVTGREMPARHRAAGDRIVIDCAGTERCAMATRFTYRFDDSPWVELGVEVRAQADYEGFELWLASYVLGRRSQPHFRCRDRECGARWVTPVNDSFVKDYYLAFPRDNAVAALTYDGRWGDPTVQTFLAGPYYAEPLMAVPDDDGAFAYVEHGRREEVAKICGSYRDPTWREGDPANNDTRFYSVLFGRDVTAGETLGATVRAGIVAIERNMDELPAVLR
jgi:hypothetical protein